MEIKSNLPISVNSNWTQTPCVLSGYDPCGTFKVLGMYDFSQYGIVSAQLVNPSTIVGISNRGLIVQFAVKPPTAKQPNFSISVTAQIPLGNWNSLVSTAVSADGQSVVLTDFGGIRKYGKGGEFITSFENDVLILRLSNG